MLTLPVESHCLPHPSPRTSFLHLQTQMPKSKKSSVAASSSSSPSLSSVDKQMADIAAQIAALSARQDAAIKEMQRAAEEVALQSKVHERLAQELARAEIEKSRLQYKLHTSRPSLHSLSHSSLALPQSLCRSRPRCGADGSSRRVRWRCRRLPRRPGVLAARAQCTCMFPACSRGSSIFLELLSRFCFVGFAQFWGQH